MSRWNYEPCIICTWILAASKETLCLLSLNSPYAQIPEVGRESEREITQSCLTLCRPHAPGSSVHGILQARVLEWVAISFSRGSSQPGDWTQVSCIAGGFVTVWATREAQLPNTSLIKKKYSLKERKESFYNLSWEGKTCCSVHSILPILQHWREPCEDL